MTNSVLPTTIPIPYQTPLTDTNGRITDVWYRFFLTLFQRSGGANPPVPIPSDFAALEMMGSDSGVTPNEFATALAAATSPEPIPSPIAAALAVTTPQDPLPQSIIAAIIAYANDCYVPVADPWAIALATDTLPNPIHQDPLALALAASTEPASAAELAASGAFGTGGWLITSNYQAKREVDFWSTVNSDLSGGQGFYFLQKISATTQALLALLYGDNSSYTYFEINNAAAKTFLYGDGTVGSVGTSSNTQFQIHVNNVAIITLSTGQNATFAGNVTATTKASLLPDQIYDHDVACTAQLDKTNNNTLATVTGLSLALVAGKTYVIEGYLSTTSGAAGGLKVALVASGGLTATSARFNGFAWNGTTAVANTTVTALASSIVANNAIVTDVYIKGTIVVNVAGTINLQAAQNTADATTTSVFINSTFSARRIN